MSDFLENELKRVEAEAKRKVAAGEDGGHNLLIQDLEQILAEAKALQFHDFLNTAYAAPKVQLERFLEQMRQATMNGKYDN